MISVKLYKTAKASHLASYIYNVNIVNNSIIPNLIQLDTVHIFYLYSQPYKSDLDEV